MDDLAKDDEDEVAMTLQHRAAGRRWTEIADKVLAPSRHLGAVEDTTNQVTELPTPPAPDEEAAQIFDPQRDITPG